MELACITGQKELQGGILKLVRELDNPVDVNAGALYNETGSKKMAYLGWTDAKRGALLMQHANVLNKQNLMAIVTGNLEVVDWDQGPRQTCNVAFQVFECHSEQLLDYIKEIDLLCSCSIDIEKRFPLLLLAFRDFYKSDI